ncbi:MAG: coenzyme F420-0:L-glutamate ligase [Pseudomonadota bacterium]
MGRRITVEALTDIPLVNEGDELAELISASLTKSRIEPQNGDILVIAQKIVSKAEGRIVDLNKVVPSQRALDLAAKAEKDPRLLEVILAESTDVIRSVRGVVITRHKNGWVMANAGIDASNVKSEPGEECVLLLPKNPDRTCHLLRKDLEKVLGIQLGVIVSDSFGRPWRHGTTGVALGASGIRSLWDRRGEKDLFGREMQTSQQALADELASAASLIQGQGAESCPIALIRGCRSAMEGELNSASTLLREIEQDLFQ